MIVIKTETMTAQTNQTSNLYALLIGIDCYLPNRLPDGSSYKSLSGCVRDINHVEAFLKQMRKVPEAQILKLTASKNPTSITLENSARSHHPDRKYIFTILDMVDAQKLFSQILKIQMALMKD